MGISDILKTLADRNSPVLLMLIAVLTAIYFMRQYVEILIKLRKARIEFGGKPHPPARDQEKTKAKDPQEVVNFNFSLLEKYYEQTLGEYKLNSRATIIVASLGFAVILMGAGFVLTGSATVGAVSSVAGFISEAATLMFFKQNQIQIKQVEEYHKKLVSTQYLLTAISLSEGLPDSLRHLEKKRIITNLLYLSNELHGSPSPHLLFTNSEPRKGEKAKKE